MRLKTNCGQPKQIIDKNNYTDKGDTIMRLLHTSPLLLLTAAVLIGQTLCVSVVTAQEDQETLSIAEQVAAKRVNQHQQTQEQLEKIQTLYQEEKYQEAIDMLSPILDKDPDNTEAKELMDQCISKQKANMVAEVIARKQRSKQHVMENLNNEFIELWRRPDEVDKERDYALSQMLQAVRELWEIGRYHEAIDGCEEMIETYPPDVTARVKINEMLEDMRLFAEEESEVIKRKRILAVRKAWLPPKHDKKRKKIRKSTKLIRLYLLINNSCWQKQTGLYLKSTLPMLIFAM